MTPVRLRVVVLLLLATWLALCGVDWHAIATAANEMGDAAANSLLVQDAKSLTLLVGNYSRVGFNHPGPAILDVLAAGEWALYDVLHVVRSPYAGQLVAIALYNAGWIVAGFCVIRRTAGSSSIAAMMVAGFLVAATAWRGELFASAWFPDLYFLPFAVSLLCFARLASGRYDAIVTLAVSAGVLINGHVAFIAILAFLAAGTMVVNTVMAATGHGAVSSLRSNPGPADRRRISLATAVLLAFFVPLALQTVLHPPGSLVDYVRFGHAHRRNNIPSSLRFVGLFWSVPARVAALLVALSLLSKRAALPGSTRWNALVAMLVAGTVAVFLYAMFGVDEMDQAYIAYFYAAVPAWTVTLCVLRLWCWLPARFVTAATWPTTVALAIAVLMLSEPREGDLTPATTAQIPAFDAAVERLDSAGPVIFDLDPTGDYRAVWPFLVGVAVHARRDHRQPFCIDRGWHVLFTRALSCDLHTSRSARRYQVRTVEEGAAEGFALVFAYGGVGVFVDRRNARGGAAAQTAGTASTR